MNKIINSKELIDLISKEGEFNKEFVDVFLNNLVLVIEDSLIAGEDVKIEGLGEFKVSNTQGGEKKNIVFISDESLRKEINAPFEQFEPIIISNSTQNFNIIPEEDSLNSTKPNNKDEDFVKIESNKLNNVDMKENDEKKSDSDKINDFNKENGKINNSDVSKELTETSSDENQEISSIKTIDKESKNNDPQGFISDKSIDEVNNATTTDSEASKKDFDKEDIKQANQPPLNDNTKKSSCCNIVNGETETECEEYVRNTNKSGIMIIVMLIGIAIVSFLIYFLVIVNKNDKSPDIDKINKELQDQERTAPQDEIKEEEIVPNMDSISKNNLQKEEIIREESNINNNQRYPELLQIPNKPVILTKGQRLTLLALRYYGDKAFWVYIYDANKLKYPNPENIPAGAELTIPQMSKYSIDYKNPESIRKAKNEASKILKQYQSL